MILNAVNIIVISVLAYQVRRHATADLKPFLWPALVLKLLAGIAVGFVYQYYYSEGDTFMYHHDGRVLVGLAKTNFPAYTQFLWDTTADNTLLKTLYFHEPRALFFSKIASVVMLVTGTTHYYGYGLWFSILSFLAAWKLVAVLNFHFPATRASAVIAFLFFPSCVFWSAGIIKESIAMAALFFLAALFLKGWHAKKLNAVEWLCLPIVLWLLWAVKYYYFAVFCAVTFTTLLMRLLMLSRMAVKPVWQVTLWFVLFLVPLYGASVIHPNFYPERFLEVIVTNYEAFVTLSDPVDVVQFSGMKADAATLACHVPKALVSGLFRPLLWEADTAFKLLIAVENLFLFVFTLAALFSVRKLRLADNRLLLLATLVYILILCIFLTLSTPNFGTLSRYRVAFLPFMVYLVCIPNRLIARLVDKMDSLVL
jgi:hypothetical protein